MERTTCVRFTSVVCISETFEPDGSKVSSYRVLILLSMFHDRLTAQRNIKSYFVLIVWLLFFYSGIWTHQLSDEHLSTAVLVATHLDVFNMMVTFSWCIGGKKMSYFWDQTFSSHVGGDSNTDRRHILVTTRNRKLTFNISVVYRNIHSFFWLSWRINISDLCVLQLYTHTTLIVVFSEWISNLRGWRSPVSLQQRSSVFE